MSRNRKYLIVVSPIALMAGAPALAQTVDGSAPTSAAVSIDDQDIVVTAQRREQSLLKVPLAISALNSQALDKKGITTSNELGSAVPNLQVGSPYGIIPNFTLRGWPSPENVVHFGS